MPSESELIPFHTSELYGETLLVLAPHPDDEVLGCGGLIALHTKSRRRVHVVVATDGSAAESGPGLSDTRRAETDRGLAQLGAGPATHLQLPDRELESQRDQLSSTLRELLLDLRPDLVALPAPVDFHPDHRALTGAFVSLIQADPDLHGHLANCRIAFYEVGQPIRPNVLVDISDVAEMKFGAIDAHESQTSIRDYGGFARSINRFRALTLEGVQYAEAYWVTTSEEIRTSSIATITSRLGPSTPIEITRETVPITVVVRTRNRLPLLAEAIASIRANDHPSSIVVFNDGGESPRDAVRAGQDLTIIDSERQIGRSAAANEAAKRASDGWLAFLDDDDLFCPDHLSTLARAVTRSSHAGYYSDAVSVWLRPAESGDWKEEKRLRIYARDFDPTMLLADNYIPLPTLLVNRATWLDLGGFDGDLDLFEDWDFMIRLSSKGSLLRIPKVTCEIRHFVGGDSVVLAAPAGSAKFREARMEIRRRHQQRFDLSSWDAVYDRMKQERIDLVADAVEQRGRSARIELDVHRLERDKAQLLDQLRGLATRASDLERDLDARLADVGRLEASVASSTEEIARLRADLTRAESAIEGKDEAIESMFAEIARLDTTLRQIYGSRTWKLHRLAERIRGRK